MSTLADTRHRAGDADVNNGSGFWQTLLGKRTAAASEPEEPFTPNAQSRWLLDHVKADLRGELTKAVSAITHAKRTVASPTDLDGSHPAYLLRRLAMLALDMEIDPKVTFADAVERLQWAWDMLLERAAEESAFERHAPVNAVEAAADGALLGGRPSAARAQVVVADIVERAVNAPKPTALQVAMTPDVLERIDKGESPESVAASLPATAVMSPVRVDGTTPPVPADVPAVESLPRRPEPVNVLAARDTHPYTSVDPTDEDAELAYGSWVFDEGCGSTGQVWLKLARRHVEVHEEGGLAARLDYCNGTHVELRAGRQVRVLDPSRARELLAEHEQELAARDAAEAAR